jgi:hypothetical protein
MSEEEPNAAKGLRTVLQAALAVLAGITAATGPHWITASAALLDLGVITGAAFGRREHPSQPERAPATMSVSFTGEPPTVPFLVTIGEHEQVVTRIHEDGRTADVRPRRPSDRLRLWWRWQAFRNWITRA